MRKQVLFDLVHVQDSKFLFLCELTDYVNLVRPEFLDTVKRRSHLNSHITRGLFIPVYCM